MLKYLKYFTPQYKLSDHVNIMLMLIKYCSDMHGIKNVLTSHGMELFFTSEVNLSSPPGFNGS